VRSCRVLGFTLILGSCLFGGSLTYNGSNFLIEQLDTSSGAFSSDGEFFVSNAVGVGFINVLDSSNNWLVQNLPVGLDAFGTIADRFNITSGVGPLSGSGDLLSANLKVDFSATPLADVSTIVGDPVQSGLSAPDMTLAIGGTGDNDSEDGVSAPGANVTFALGGNTKINYQTGHPNVDAGVNQCAPAAVANSLSWLGVATTPNNPGTFGAANSLAARLDTLMGRISNQCPPASPGPPPVAAGPCGVWPLDGKLAYLNSIGQTNLEVNFQNAADNPGNAAGNGNGLGVGDYQAGAGNAGAKAINKGAPSFDFIQSEIAKGEDVEIDIRFPCPTAANPARICRHYVEVTGAGTILGQQWITHVSDQNQGVAGGNTSTQFDWVMGTNGLPGWGAGAQIDQVISESTPEPGTFALLGVGLLALLARRFSHQRIDEA